MIFGIAKVDSYLPTYLPTYLTYLPKQEVGTNFSRHWKKLSTLKGKYATLRLKTEKPKVGEYLFHL